MTEEQEPYNAANPAHVKKRERRAKDQSEQEMAELAALLKLPEFRRYLWRHLEACGMFRTSFNPSGSVVYFNEGARNQGLAMWAEIVQADESAILLLMQESKAAATP